MSDDRSSRQFEEVVARVMPRLLRVRADGLDDEVQHTLRAFVECLDADRGTVFVFDPATGEPSFRSSWARDGQVAYHPSQAAALDWVLAEMRAGRVVRLPHLPRDVPPIATNERAHVIAVGLKSFLMVPGAIENRWVCALTVGMVTDYRAWTDADERRVGFFAEILASAVHRCRQNAALEAHLGQATVLNQQLTGENAYLREELDTTLPFKGIVGKSPAMTRVLRHVQQVADADSTVLILGETGSGKELIARAIHDKSRRRHKPMVKVNCAALPAGLVESELFGHERGAFTGAIASKPGRFEVADGGTLFLDEVGDLPPESQAKLLRVLQEGEFERLGSTRTRSVDVRIISATNRDLHEDVAVGRFREDLFYRLAVFELLLPPLRNRLDDLEPLARFIVDRRARALGRRVNDISADALRHLRAYDWPGNVRELENVLERALILSPGTTLELDEPLSQRRRIVPPRSRPATLPAAVRPTTPVAPAGEALEAFERAHLVAVLDACGWKINGAGQAAQRLQMHPSTLRSRLKKLGINRPA